MFAFVSAAGGAGRAATPVVPPRILLSWYHGWVDDELHEPRALKPGERWRLTVRLKQPHGNANPGGFDYEAWLFERGIRATGYVRPRAIAERVDALVPRPLYLVERLRHSIRQRFANVLGDAPYLGVLTALAVGDQRAIDNAQWRVFNRTGITHLVSISGMHVTMLAALAATVFGRLWRRSERLALCLPAQKAAILAGGLAAFAYALLSGFAVPAQRTFYMLAVVAVALWSGRNFGASRTLALALLAVLLFDPWAILSPGFWLSFGAVALLFFVAAARVSVRAESPHRHPWRTVRGWRTVVADWGATQWAVTLGSLPLLLILFQQFSLVSPLANAVAIPVISFLVTPLALLFVVLPWAPVLHLAHLVMLALMHLLQWLADWPMWQQAAPPLHLVLLALAGVVWLLLPRGFPARWLGICLLLPALWPVVERPSEGEAWVDVLDVGQGLAVVVRTANHVLLYDTGPMYSAEADAGQRIIVPWLRSTGISALDALVVTHRDKDHSGGLASVREALPVRKLLSSLPELDGEPCVAGQQWAWDGVRFAFLHPVVEDYTKAARKTNNMSCVLRVWTDDGGILLTSDIEAADEAALLGRSAAMLRNEVLVAPHHGSRTSSTPAFVAAVGAREVIFPVGYRNRFQHPRPDVVDRYAGSRLWRSDRDGRVRVVLGPEIRLSAWRQERRRYWQAGATSGPDPQSHR